MILRGYELSIAEERGTPSATAFVQTHLSSLLLLSLQDIASREGENYHFIIMTFLKNNGMMCKQLMVFNGSALEISNFKILNYQTKPQ